MVGRGVGAGAVRLVPVELDEPDEPDELERLLPPNRLLPERLEELPVEREPLPLEGRDVEPRLWEAGLVEGREEGLAEGLAEGREPPELLVTRLPWRCMGSA